MRKPLAKRIQEQYPQMSKSHKKIGEYMLQHYDQAVFLTASKLGQMLSVSEATVIRFAVLLGYDGYPELQKALQDMVRNRITTVDRLKLSPKDSRTDIVRSVFNMDSDNMRQTLEGLNTKDFALAVDKMIGARRIYIVSLRSAVVLGQFLHFYLQLLFKNCQMVSGNLFVEGLAGVGPEDLVIGFSFARYTRQTVESMQYAREKGASTIGITDTLTSPLAPYSEVLLLAQSATPSFIDSFVAPLSLVNALVIAAGTYDLEKTTQTLADFEEGCDKFGVYYKE